jgi:hypothetical protein
LTGERQRGWSKTKLLWGFTLPFIPSRRGRGGKPWRRWFTLLLRSS